MDFQRNDPLLMPPLPEYIAHADEVAAGDALNRDGAVDTVPDGHTLVVATVRHRYTDTERGVDFVALAGQHYAMRSDRVPRNVASGIVVVPTDAVLDWYAPAGRVLLAEDGDAAPLVNAPAPTSVKIAAGCGFDPGAAAFRLHTAVNEHTHHASVFVRWGNSNPHCSLRQYDGITDGHLVRQAVASADVIHNHVAYFLVNNTGVAPKSWQLVVRHYHGSSQHGTLLEPKWDTARGAVLFGARLQLVAEAERMGLTMRWSPIPVPVDRYAAMADAVRTAHGWTPLAGAATPLRPLRIAHSPTNTRLKGTDVLRRAVDALQRKGVPVVLDMIAGVSLTDALRRKALADVCFDSFWLGMQGSGLEAAAMGVPVIAGDHEAAELASEVNGGVCPYVFANDEAALGVALERMAMDAGAREHAAATVHAFVRHFHDYAAVAARYETDLSELLGRNVRTPGMAPTVTAEPKKRGRPRKVAA